MNRAWIVLAGAAAILWSSTGPVHAQQQYGDPTNFPGTYLTQGSSPPAPIGAPTIDVTYFVGAGFNAAQHSLINQAAALWTAAGASVRLVEVGAGGADITFAPQNLNNNTTNLASRTIATAPGPGTYPDGTPWRRILSANIIIDSNPPGPLPYFFGPGNVPVNQFDYMSILIREFGFGLGLGFATSEPGSVMDSALGMGEQHRTLSPGDIGALNALYGTPEPATWALFGIGLLTLGVARKRRKK